GFAKGGNENSLENLSDKEKQDVFDKFNKKDEPFRKEYPDFPIITLENYLTHIDKIPHRFYKSLAGEVEAFNTEKRLNLTPEQRRKTLLQETEDVSREEQTVLFNMLDIKSTTNELAQKLGIDLSSEVYAQRRDESDEEYNDRLLKEVEAYLTSPQIADKLENLKKENLSKEASWK
ncbi:hypothetical protein EBU94_04700, partial [bacterium]|nr:hypothetical protein [bacterium]